MSCTSTRERTLVEIHINLPRCVAAKVFPRVRAHIDMDELIALGNAGLVEAAQRFDVAGGASFRTFAWYRVYGEMMDAIRRLLPFGRKPLRASAIALDHELETPVPDPGGDLDLARFSIDLRAALALLPESERQLLQKHYWEDKDLLSAGAELGRSKSWASRSHAKAITHLRAEVGLRQTQCVAT